MILVLFIQGACETKVARERECFIKFPIDADTVHSLKANFFRIAHFPNCVGAFDWTLIPIKEMSGFEKPAFICRKNFCNVLTQICGN